MDDLKKLNDALEEAIRSYERKTLDYDSLEQRDPVPETRRDRLGRFIHSPKFLVFIIVLVVVDCLLVLAELLIDLKLVELHKDHEIIGEVIHIISISILSLFLIEIGVRLYVLRRSFFASKLEVFDAFVVIVSFVLDIVFMGVNHDVVAEGASLIIILRLWRVTRIINGIVLSVKKQSEKSLEIERKRREACEEQLKKYQEYCAALQAEVDRLRGKK